MRKLLGLLPLLAFVVLAFPVPSANAASVNAAGLQKLTLKATDQTNLVDVRWRRHHRHHHHHRHHRRHRFYFSYGYYPSYYYVPRVYRRYRGRCHWLKHKARRTGSHYWWRRYRKCRRRHW